MRRRKMGAIFNIDNKSTTTLTSTTNDNKHRTVIENIEGVIKLYADGHVDRPEIMPSVPPTSQSNHLPVVSKDITIDKATGIWARLYAPKRRRSQRLASAAIDLPLLFYFHGGGFCVGSASWRCYHEFLTQLAVDARCVIVSVNYRLAPENKLPTAYEDGLKAVRGLLNQEQPVSLGGWEFKWSEYRESGNVFLSGDSSGGNIAFNVAQWLGGSTTSDIKTTGNAELKPIKGMVLIQPFFGGEVRTNSENHMGGSSSVLTLAVSDSYWRLALPAGLNRDHPWSNPVIRRARMKVCRTLVCVSELDILKDRELEFCASLACENGNVVEHEVYKGVGHAFQILDKSMLSTVRTQEMISRIRDFIN